MFISVLPENTPFTEDLSRQIKLFLPDSSVEMSIPTSKTNLLLIDEEIDSISAIAEQYKELPIVVFSSTQEVSDVADLVIKKPFHLNKFLFALKNNTLLPKVRRKECINIKEYSLYPVKKEIISAKTTKSIKITEREVEIIKYLYQIFPQSAAKEDLLENVWGYSADATTHTVETHIYRLRQKVEKDGGSQLIITENSGYRLNL